MYQTGPWILQPQRVEVFKVEEFQSSILEQVDVLLQPSIRESDKMRSSTFQCYCLFLVVC